MASPNATLRSSFETLLKNNVSYTKKRGGTVKPTWFETLPDIRTHFPIMRYADCALEPSDSKDCRGWECTVTIQVMAGYQPGHGSYYDVDEMERAVHSLITDEPFALDVGVNYNLVDIIFQGSDYNEQLVSATSKPNVPSKYIVSKELDFLVILVEV